MKLDGLTLRDLFAAAALAGILANPENRAGDYGPTVLEAYEFANAMMEERCKRDIDVEGEEEGTAPERLEKELERMRNEK